MIGQDIIKNFCKDLPEKPGIYKMIGEGHEILYIGKAKNLKNRVIYYTKNDLPLRLSRMVFLVRRLEYIITKSEAEAFLLEASQIKISKPKFNILLKDDKSFPYIKINFSHEYPQIMKFRGKLTKATNGKTDAHYGPFASNGDVERSINIIKKIFKIRGCSDNYFAGRKRPCMFYQIKKCSAPCVNKISKEDYLESVNNAGKFLSGKSAELQKIMSTKMEEYAENLDFEKAAEVRDSLKALSYIQVNTTIQGGEGMEDADVIGVVSKNNIYCVQVFFYRSGQNYGTRVYFPVHSEEKTEEEVFSGFIGQFYQSKHPAKQIISNVLMESKESVEEALLNLHGQKCKFLVPKSGFQKKILDHVIMNAMESLESHQVARTKNDNILEKITNLFDLTETPTRIEVYDNSHIMGKFAVGAMIVAGKDGFDKKEYRKYTIESNTNMYGGDDYQMLREVLTRRVKRFAAEPERIPSLFIIDGGKAHLNVATKVLEENNIDIPVVSMSKGEKRNAGGETFHMKDRDDFTLSNNDDEMKYLQILRDEVHNFAITSHRQKRSRAIGVSLVDQIPSVGGTRKKQLLNYFGSYDAIRNANIEDLEKVPGISRKIAEKIHGFFR